MSIYKNRRTCFFYSIKCCRFNITIVFICVLAYIAGFPLRVNSSDRPVFSGSQLTQFIKGSKEPPDDLKIVLRAASVAPEGSSWYNYALKKVIPEIRSLSNGLLELKLYAGGVMGDEADTIRKMKMNQLQVVGVTNMGLTMMVPELSVLSLPFLFDWEPDLFYAGKRTQVDYILEKLEPSVARLAEKHGYQFLGLLETCFEALGSKIPIQSTSDLQHIKFWLWRGDRVRSEINKILQINTMPMELYDVSQGLSTGNIDTTQVAWYVSIVLQWWPHIKYVTDYPIYGYESASIMADKQTFSDLYAFINKWGYKYSIDDPDKLLQSFLALADNSFTNLRFILRKDEAKARDKLLSEGIQELHFPESELEKLRSKIEPQYIVLSEQGKYPLWLLEEILQYRDEYRKYKENDVFTKDWYDHGIMPDGNMRNEWRESFK